MAAAKITGQVVKVQTTADECIRLTIDIDSHYASDNNFIKWKNEMLELKLTESKKDFYDDLPSL